MSAAAAAPSAAAAAVHAAPAASTPAASSAVWTALSSMRFRHAKLRASELPSRFLHVSMQRDGGALAADQTQSQAAAGEEHAVSAQHVWRMFAPFGELDGVQLIEASKPHPKATMRQFAYVSFRHAAHASQALMQLHQKYSAVEPEVRLHVHHAVEREEHAEADSAPASSAVAADAADAASSSSSSASPPPAPSGLLLYPSSVPAPLCSTLASAVSHLSKGDLSFGAALAEEDDRFGLRKPKPLGEQCIEVVKAVQDATSGIQPALPAPNRVTLSVLRPGQGVKRSRDAPHLFGAASTVLNLGPSHVVVEFAHPLRSAKERWGVLLTAGSMLVLSGEVRSEFEWSVPSKTRDVLAEGVENCVPFVVSAGADPPPGAVNMKRGNTVLCVMRHVLAEPLPAPAAEAATSAQAKLTAKEKRAKREKDEAAKDKKVHSTAIQIPGSAATASASSASSSSSPGVDAAAESAAAAMESLHVTGVYDSIATHFSNTRHSPWPRIESFVESLPAGSIVADVGCGNGKYMGLNRSISIRGCDASKELARIAREEKGFDVIVGDLMQIPFESRAFDAVLCIAVLHHISTLARRQRGARELMRLLRVGGRLLVSAWALEQDSTSRRAFPSQDVLVPWAIPSRFVEQDERAMQVARDTTAAQVAAAAQAQSEAGTVGKDGPAAAATEAASSASRAVASPSPSPSPSAPAVVDPSSGLSLVHYQRYCHVYTEGELESLFTAQFGPDEMQIVQSYYDRGNWCVVVQKNALTKFDRAEMEEQGGEADKKDAQS